MKKYRDNKEFCPSCKENMQGKPIKKKDQPAFGSTHFSRKIGIYDRMADRTVAWKCPDCGHEWARTEAPTPWPYRSWI